MNQQEIKSGAAPEAPEFSGSEGSGTTGSAPRNEWTARFDSDAAARDGQAKAETENAEAVRAGRPADIPLPKVDFSTFILSLASSALVQLGEVPNPETGKSEENLQLAKHTVDIIAMLQEKTRTGLNEEESKLMEGVLYELRMKYVIKSR